MTNYLLDTDIAIELLRGRNVRLAEHLAGRDRDDILLSTVTVAELLFGALRSREPEKGMTICRQFCSSFRLAALDYEAAERSAAIRADLERRRERIGAYDMLIAGIALARGCTLATHNVREFGRVEGLRRGRGGGRWGHAPRQPELDLLSIERDGSLDPWRFLVLGAAESMRLLGSPRSPRLGGE